MSTAQQIAIPRRDDSRWLQALGSRGLAEALFWLVMLQLINGVFLQSQMAIFDGRVIVPNGVLKLLLVLVAGALAGTLVWLAQGRVVWRPCMLPCTLFACYLVADLAWLTQTSQVPLQTLYFGFNKFFMFFAAIPAAALLRPHLTEREMNGRLMLLILPIVGVAFAQFTFNDPILPIESENAEYAIHSLDFYGRTRAFSLFRGVLELGQYLTFFGALLVAKLCWGQARHKLLTVVLLLLTVAACVVTFRRGAYLEFGAAGLSAFLIAGRAAFCRWLPWAFFVGAIGLASVGTIMRAANSEGILSSDSLAERHDAWSEVLHGWLLKEDASLLFGTGRAQVEPDDIDNLLVDNGFLAVGAQVGLVGLVLWCWVMQSLWREMLSVAWQWKSPLATAVAALLSTWMMRDVFDPLFALYPLYVFLVFWSRRDAPPGQARSPRVRQVVA